jgi:DNA-binding NarL/FixJ family response regulator
MPALRVLYVEDDPALRSIMVEKFNAFESMRVISTSNSSGALKALEDHEFDVILLDIALGSQSLSGIELAHQAKRINPEIGVVFYSQYAETANPEKKSDYYMGWSTISKSATLEVAHLVQLLVTTAQGFSQVEGRAPKAVSPAEFLGKLSPRQQEIMGLTCQGFDANRIAESLGVASITVRTELSKIYKILIPHPETGINLRTSAVLVYLRATRASSEGAVY